MNDTAKRFAAAIRRLGDTPAEQLARLPGVSERTLRYWKRGRAPRVLVILEAAGVVHISEPAQDETPNP